MGTILLEGMEFYAYHGLYAEENRIGNRFTVDVELELDLTETGRTDDFAHGLDYSLIYKLVAQAMTERKRLIEAVAHGIAERVLQAWANVQEVRVRVSKYTPPFDGLTHRAMVEQRLRRVP